jgi:hypothetical protein
MTRAGACVCALVALLSIATLRAGDAAAPALLQRLLQSQKTWRLLEPRVDLTGFDAEALALIQARPAWLAGDFDHDGRDDVAAIVVSGPPARRRFGVVAVHAVTPRVPRWVTAFRAEPIVMVTAEPFRDAIAVYACTECDAQPWFRWSGRSYELGLHAMGDDVAIGEAKAAELLALPRATAARRGTAPPCAKARVHDVAGRPGARWYFVETMAQPKARGWIAASAVAAGDDCF